MTTETKTESPSGIGGWLILVLLGLLASPIRILFYAYENFWPLYSEGLWLEFTKPSSAYYHPAFAPIVSFEIAGNALLLLIGLWTLYLFLRKSKHTPLLAIIWFATAFVFAAIDAVLIRQVPLLAAEVTGYDAFKEIVGSALRATIWIPYFLISKRVKATFTR